VWGAHVERKPKLTKLTDAGVAHQLIQSSTSCLLTRHGKVLDTSVMDRVAT